jgi:hypothetical protein
VRKLGLDEVEDDETVVDTFRRPERKRAATGPQLSLPLL